MFKSKKFFHNKETFLWIEEIFLWEKKSFFSLQKDIKAPN